MKSKAIGLALATFIGALALAACDKTEVITPAPGVAQTGPAMTPTVTPSTTPQVALGTPSTPEKKNSTPVQGQVDPREQAQRRDFEQKK